MKDKIGNKSKEKKETSGEIRGRKSYGKHDVD